MDSKEAGFVLKHRGKQRLKGVPFQSIDDENIGVVLYYKELY